ncbi:MAG: dihydrolipoamide acetyltransferase family protein [Pseudanabaenaceae cyanobacterium]
MIREVFMPALSSTMTEGKIVAWVKAPGDKVAKGETVVVVESDKADMDVESFYEGYLGAIAVPAGQTAAVGVAIAYIAETEEELAEALSKGNGQPQAAVAPPSFHAPATLEAQPSPAAVAAIPETVAPRTGRIVASPRAKRLAKENGIDLTTVTGTGPNGRITAANIEALIHPINGPINGQTPAAGAVPTPVPPAATPATTAPVPSGVSSIQPFTTLQGAVIRNMNTSLTVPVFRVSYTITVEALEALYKQLKAQGVTLTVLLAKAIALTLRQHPLLNAAYTDTGVAFKNDINVAVAVAMEDGGLITPVLRQADRTDVYELSRQWKSLVARARSKQLQPEEYNSGTFTLSNLGMFGVDRFDAILPPGTGSILAVGGTQANVVALENGAIAVRRQMNVTITCDHRIIYGAHAAQFLQDLAKLLETESDRLTR